MTKKEKILNILKDLKPHCTVCELSVISGQYAKITQNLRDEGYEFFSPKEGRYVEYIFCKNCGRKEYHTRLLNIKAKKAKTKRVNFSPFLRSRIRNLYHDKDAFLNSKTKRPEVDHREPPRRYGYESFLDERNSTDEDLKKRYMILDRINNMRKREVCKKCIETDIRQMSLTGIKYFFSGSEKYEGTCYGCFWAYPEKWRDSLNERIR